MTTSFQTAGFHQFFDRYAGPVVLLDAMHRLTGFNPSAKALFGEAPDLVRFSSAPSLSSAVPFSSLVPDYPRLFQRWSADKSVELLHVEIKNKQYQIEITALDTGEYLLILRELAPASLRQQALASHLDEASTGIPAYDASLTRSFYETILSNTPDLIYVFGLDHRFIYANKVLLEMWGLTWEQAIGKNCLELGYEPWHADMHDKEIELVKLTRQPLAGEVPFNGTFGRRVYHYIFTPVIGPDGEVQAIAGTTRDITERHETEETLRLSREALQMADRRKDEFLAMLAHELRNPLAPISAAAQIMVLGNLDEQRVKRSSQIIDRQVRHMVGLIDDLLDVSRVTRGLVVIDKSPQDIKAVIASSI